MCFGDYEGVKNIRQKPECPVYLLFEEPEKYVAKDGAESFEELYHRTGEFIEQVLRPQLEAGKNVLVVGHGAMNCSIVNQFRGTHLQRISGRICRETASCLGLNKFRLF